MLLDTRDLVLNLDAQSIDSYLGQGSKWWCLVDNDNYAFLINNPGFDRRWGGCFDFLGTEYVLSLNLVEKFIYGNNNYSVEVWFKSSADGAVVTELGSPAGQEWFANQIELVNGKIVVGVWTISGIAKLELCEYKSDQWHHVILTYNSGVLSGYVDGELIASKNNVVRLDPWSYGYGYYLALAYCSKSHMGSASHFYGSISSMRLYNVAINSDQVKQNYLATRDRHAIIHT